jgi:adenylyltransferase/sulfurtransferase
MGTLQATEVIKLLLGIGEPLIGRLLLFDALEMSFRTLKVRRNPDCPVCGDHPTVTELIDYEQFCGIPGQPAHVSADEHVPEVTVWDLKTRRENGNPPFLLDVRKPFEDDIATLGADQLIPHDELADRIGELRAGPDDEIIVHCRSGVRSATAVEILQDAGYRRVFNLTGGILAWAREVDPSVPQY